MNGTLLLRIISIVIVIIGSYTARKIPDFPEHQNSSLRTPTILSQSINNRIPVKIIRVIDGDTVKLETGETVRYIGIDAPESVDPRRPVGCYGKEAAEYNRNLVEGKQIVLEKDLSDTDKFGRLLRYIWLDDVLINEKLIRDGFALASSYPPDVLYQDRFIESERLARSEGKGLWGYPCVQSK